MTDDKQYAALQQIGKNCAECIVELVAALECDYAAALEHAARIATATSEV